MKKATLFTLLATLVLIPGTLYLGTILPGRSYYITGTLIILYLLVPFFLSFEGRKPQARELVMLAVLCALSVASRSILAVLPHFKPMYGVIMIAGIAFGTQAGFLVGAISAFASNFLFGQGPWTPWQMLAYGICGCIAGLVYRRKLLGNHPLVLAIFGFVTVFFTVCPILDACTLFTMVTKINWKSIVAVFSASLPANLLQASSTFVTLLLLGKPLLLRLERIKIKYGM